MRNLSRMAMFRTFCTISYFVRERTRGAASCLIGTTRKVQAQMRDISAARPRVLIVEDEFMIALDLEQSMIALGFDVCGLAPNGNKARSLAMSGNPDLVLMDVCLEGGREGIESARWL